MYWLSYSKKKAPKFRPMNHNTLYNNLNVNLK